MTENYQWQVHINEGFVVNVKAPDVEVAITQAFAKYWKENPKPIILVFDIQVLNLTQYKFYEEARKSLKTTTKPYCI